VWGSQRFDFSQPDTTGIACNTYWGTEPSKKTGVVPPQTMTERQLHSFCMGIGRDILMHLGIIPNRGKRKREYLTWFYRGSLMKLIGLGEYKVGEGKGYFPDIGEVLAEIYNAIYVWAKSTLPESNAKKIANGHKVSKLSRANAVWHLVSTLVYRATDPLASTLFIARTDGKWWSKNEQYIEINNRRLAMRIRECGYINVGGDESRVDVCWYERDNNSHFMREEPTYDRMVQRDQVVKLWAEIDGFLTDAERRVLEVFARYPTLTFPELARKLGMESPTAPGAIRATIQGVERKVGSNPEYKNRMSEIFGLAVA
jgi:hypothetical protein